MHTAPARLPMLAAATGHTLQEGDQLIATVRDAGIALNVRTADPSAWTNQQLASLLRVLADAIEG